MKKLMSIIAVAAFCVSTAYAQRIDSYIPNAPKYVIEGADGRLLKVAVRPFTNDGKIAKSIDLAEIATSMIRRGIGSVNNGKTAHKAQSFNTWTAAPLYEYTDNIDEADVILTGKCNITTSTDGSYRRYDKFETVGTPTTKLPYTVYEFTDHNEGNVLVTVSVCRRGNEMPYQTIPITYEDRQTVRTYGLRSKDSGQKYVTLVQDSFTNHNQFGFSCFFSEEKYKLPNLKTKNKGIKDQIKSLDKQINTLAKVNDVREIGKIYAEAINLEPSEHAYTGLGMCYEMIGNYTKAKECYLKSADRKSLERIGKLLKVKEIFESLGVEVVEEEF